MNVHSPKGYDKLPGNKAFSIDPYIAASLIELLRYFNLRPEKMLMWECCAGRGDLMEDLQQYGMRIYGSDIEDHPGRIPHLPIRTGINVHDQTFVPDEVNIVGTNPPFSNPLCERLIAHVLEIALRQWVAMFLPYAWPAAKSDFRQEKILGGGRWHAYARLGRRVDLVEPDADGFQDGSGMTDHTWLLFRPADMPFADARLVRLEPQVKHTKIRPEKKNKKTKEQT
ncbi:hypothetical protein [Rhizobium sp. RAF56]|uniref:hypothetical protein n=1 Tax=Rhizobium sp. RAF56 TaxID=3233062 RepID=UPI003F9DBCE5